MKLVRRGFLHFAGGVAVLASVPQIARAQNYPIRPVHLIVGFFAGSLSDIIGRVTAQSLSEGLSQQFVVDNRPGAGSTLSKLGGIVVDRARWDMPMRTQKPVVAAAP